MTITRRMMVAAALAAAFAPTVFAQTLPQVKVQTNMGDFVLELNPKAAPKTVENFLTYVKSGFYKNTLFHRVIPNFMIQGGGFVSGMEEKDTRKAIALESRNGLSNLRSTIAMARTSDPNSATSQFFINVRDNHFLDADQAQDGYGYAVFGQVISGMQTVDAIARVKTHSVGYYDDVPIRDVIIKNMTVTKGK